jgi:hypothetical protein
MRRMIATNTYTRPVGRQSKGKNDMATEQNYTFAEISMLVGALEEIAHTLENAYGNSSFHSRCAAIARDALAEFDHEPSVDAYRDSERRACGL